MTGFSPSVTIDDIGYALVVTNANPAARNALSPELYQTLHEAMDRARAEPRIAAVILTGADGFFCAGGDLNLLLGANAMTEAERGAKIDELHDLIRAMLDCPRPLIAAVEGGAAGAGLSLALACDLVVAAKGAKFTAAYVNAGLIPDAGLTAHLMGALSPQLTAEMVLLGQPVLAERFYDLGAVNRLVEAGGTLAEAKALAAALARGPAEAQAAIKGLVSAARNDWTLRQLDRERDAMGRALGQAEAGEGMRAFLEKRRPDFATMRGLDPNKGQGA